MPTGCVTNRSSSSSNGNVEPSQRANWGEDWRVRQSTTISPFSLTCVWLLWWAQEQTCYIVTGNCDYGNDFESRLKSSAHITQEHFIFEGGGGTLVGWLPGFLSPDWRSLKMQWYDCRQILRWSCRAWRLCPLVMQLVNVSWLCNSIVSVGCATIWCRLVVRYSYPVEGVQIPPNKVKLPTSFKLRNKQTFYYLIQVWKATITFLTSPLEIHPRARTHARTHTHTHTHTKRYLATAHIRCMHNHHNKAAHRLQLINVCTD